MNAMRKIIIILFVLFPLISFAQGQITRPVKKQQQQTEVVNSQDSPNTNNSNSTSGSKYCVNMRFIGDHRSLLVPKYLMINGQVYFEKHSNGIEWYSLKYDGSIFKFASTSDFKGSPAEFLESMVFHDPAPAYNPHKNNWAVRSGYIDDCKYYTRAAKVDDKYYIFYYQFPKKDPISDDTFSEIVKVISLNFPVKE